MKKLKEFADELFASNPKVNAFHLTSDGQGFEKANDAVTHGRTLDDQDVKEFQRDGSGEAEEDTSKILKKVYEFTVAQIKERLAAAQTIEAVDALIDADEDRKGVAAAVAERKEQINKPAAE